MPCASTAWTCATSTPDDLWGRIGLVPQRPFLFSGTVASNLRYGDPDATDEELWAALEVAQGADFVRMTYYTGSQNVSLIRLTLARLIRVPVHNFTLINGDTGGAFGQKSYVRSEDVAVGANVEQDARTACQVD